VQRGADTMIIAAISPVAQRRSMGRPEITDVKDLRGKPVGITRDDVDSVYKE
jgi:hypothetical protein